MSKETILSLVRTLLTAFGAFLIGKNVLGTTIDQENWQIWLGVIIGLGSAVWGILDKTVTKEKLESALRSLVVVGGGLLVAAGKAKPESIEMWAGFVAAIVPFILSWTNKSKNQDVATGKTPVANLDGVKK